MSISRVDAVNTISKITKICYFPIKIDRGIGLSYKLNVYACVCENTIIARSFLFYFYCLL